MLGSFRAELLVLRKSPAAWVLVALLPLLTLIQGYALSYLFYLRQSGPDADPSGGSAELSLPALLPAQFNIIAVGVYSFVGTVVPLVLGALTSGSDWSRGTLKTSLSQRPGRVRTFAGQTLAVGSMLIFSVVMNFAGAAGASAILQAVTHGTGSPADSAFPPLVVVAKSVAVGILISFTYGAAGLALGTLFRSAGAAIAVALLWTQGVIVLLDTLSLQVGGVLEKINDLTPDASAVSLTDSFGSAGGGADTDMYFRVDPSITGWVLAGYAAMFFLLGLILIRRRDVSG